jgi:hypothetical protein
LNFELATGNWQLARSALLGRAHYFTAINEICSSPAKLSPSRAV